MQLYATDNNKQIWLLQVVTNLNLGPWSFMKLLRREATQQKISIGLRPGPFDSHLKCEGGQEIKAGCHFILENTPSQEK